MFSYASISMTGSYDINEDCIDYIHKDDVDLFILADGLGGHQKGEVASRTVIESFNDSLIHEKEPFCKEALCRYFEKAQEALLRKNEETVAGSGMYTTAVVLVISNGQFIIGHVGDSRCYYLSGKKKYERTIDHSVPQILAITGDIKEKQIRFHPDRNRLLRVMGTEWTKAMYEIDFGGELQEKSAFLLCSDGFWELVDETYMMKCRKKNSSAEGWLHAMQTEVEKNGAGKKMDNYSAIAIVLD